MFKSHLDELEFIFLAEDLYVVSAATPDTPPEYCHYVANAGKGPGLNTFSLCLIQLIQQFHILHYLLCQEVLVLSSQTSEIF
jgi:hypothetical protein